MVHRVDIGRSKSLGAERRVGKRPFDISEALERISDAIHEYPKAALFELAEEGHSSPFEQLIACIISVRTLDEVTLETSRALFHEARTAEQLAALDVKRIDSLIRKSTFHEAKAPRLREIAEFASRRAHGTLPCDRDLLISLKGVGPKCANLVMGIACHQEWISVDTHVHRVTNRWGYVRASTPEKTLEALEAKLPRNHWIEINQLLVPFGKHVCTASLPKCSACPVQDMCQQVGVERHR